MRLRGLLKELNGVEYIDHPEEEVEGACAPARS